MHLLIATPHYPPESGGPATYAKLLADHFPERGVSVRVVRFAKVRPYPKILRPLLYLLLLLREARKADVILALDPVSTGVPAAIAACCSTNRWWRRSSEIAHGNGVISSTA